jgi:hypothetical protein
MSIFNENLRSITQTYLAPKVVDAVLRGNVLAMKLLGKPKKWSGEQMKKAVQVTKPANGGSFSGNDTFNTNTVQTKKQLAFDPKGYYQSVTIEGISRDVNASDPSRAADLVAEAMEEAGNALLDSVGTMFYGDSTGNGGKDTNGLLNIIDDGSVQDSYGGQSRTANVTLKSHVETVVGNLSSLTPLRTAEMAAKHGANKVDLIVTSETKWNEFEALLQPQLQLNFDSQGYKQVTRDRIVSSKEALKGEAGFDALYYRGAPIVADEKCPDLRMFGINTNSLFWAGLKSADPEFKLVQVGKSKQIESPAYSMENIGLHFSGLKESFNQYMVSGQFLLLGNLISWSPRDHFVIEFSA